tara:strand:- start:113 stop:307 length:195 start_codon:yes stop_codon:yes gene_type:complete
MKETLSFNKWLLYYGDDIEDMLENILSQVQQHQLEDRLINYNIYYKLAKLIYNNSYKGRPINYI